ncbi:TPA: cation:proton antiporter, partial [Klebsiella pneumoniae]|nr:cation:proton antiporter [Klebsiella pneumoniae]
SIAKLFGFPWQVAFIGATGFVLTSTAVVMQLLAERGDIALPSGQKIVSILLFEDLLIVPLLALVAWMAPSAGSADGEGSRWLSVAIGVGAIVGLVLVGRFLLNPLFRLLAESKAREVMTAAALLVVLGAALLMQLSGLSMAMGAFLAGVLLSESTFRHQIEADIEPFRGILLGLFFLSVGMALDLGVVASHWELIAGLVLALMAA